jgi:hypothetical protein
MSERPANNYQAPGCQVKIKGMKLTKPGELLSFAGHPRCSADQLAMAWNGVSS